MFVMKQKAADGEEEGASTFSSATKAAGLIGYFIALRVAFAAVQYATYAGEMNQ